MASSKAVGIIEMLINAEEPRVIKRRVVIGLSLEDPRKGLMQALLLQYDAAGHEIESAGSLLRSPSRMPMAVFIGDCENTGVASKS